jgi:hypothetical protein
MLLGRGLLLLRRGLLLLRRGLLLLRRGPLVLLRLLGQGHRIMVLRDRSKGVLADAVDELAAVRALLGTRSTRHSGSTGEVRALLRLGTFANELDIRDGVVFLARERLWGRLGERTEALNSVGVTMVGGLFSSQKARMSSRLMTRTCW